MRKTMVINIRKYAVENQRKPNLNVYAQILKQSCKFGLVQEKLHEEPEQ